MDSYPWESSDTEDEVKEVYFMFQTFMTVGEPSTAASIDVEVSVLEDFCQKNLVVTEGVFVHVDDSHTL